MASRSYRPTKPQRELAASMQVFYRLFGRRAALHLYLERYQDAFPGGNVVTEFRCPLCKGKAQWGYANCGLCSRGKITMLSATTMLLEGIDAASVDALKAGVDILTGVLGAPR